MSLEKADTFNSRLLYHTAVSVGMDFGADGSSAQTKSVSTSLSKYFKYYSGVRYVARYEDDKAWTDLLISELNAGRPLIYSGHPADGTPGHAFNIDGVDSRGYFHVNWGWSGSYNGYYLINNLRPGSSDFTTDQGAVINIRPPVYCPTDLSLTKTSVKERLPAGTYVGKLKITDEAVDNVYTLWVKGDSVSDPEYMPADFYLSNDSLFTAREFLYIDKNAYTLYIEVQDKFGNSYQEKFTISIIQNSLPSGAEDWTKAGYRVFPNPSGGNFYVHNPGGTPVTLELVNTDGRIVLSLESREGESQLEISHPVAGLYLLRITSSSGISYSSKVVIR
jgi:hypothetical protein